MKLIDALSADDEYSRHNREDLPLPILMQLSKKRRQVAAFLYGIFRIYIKF